MPKIVLLPFFTLFSLFLYGQRFQMPDTLVSVFHHNYLIERQMELQQFADELVAYSNQKKVSDNLRRAVLMYRKEVYDIEVWKSEDVVDTKINLDYLLAEGTRLRNKMLEKETIPHMSNILSMLIGTIVIFSSIFFYLLKHPQK